jgi:Ca-activated chloride channel family protein
MRRLRLIALAVLAVLASVHFAFADAGVLVPSNREQPDPSILSLQEMSIDVRIDNGDACVSIRQIYQNRTGRILEGNYVFALPAKSTVSDFAVWDDVTRIPGVILERKRADEIYNALKWQSIDPGLLQMGERTASEARRSSVFSARIVPIPGYGSKRVEIEYHETLPVENLATFFAVPLHPEAYHVMTAGRLAIHFELRSSHAVRDFQSVGGAYPLSISKRTANLVVGTFAGTNVTFNQDFAVKYAFDESRADSLTILTYRNSRPQQPSPVEEAPARPESEPGFFEVSALFGPGKSQPAATDPGTVHSGAPRTVVTLFDTSLSMQWDKLDRSFQALEALLASLRSSDRFNVLLFNTRTSWFAPQPVAASRDNVNGALEFVRKSDIRGGTNLEQALGTALGPGGQGPNNYLVLLSDGDPTGGTINHSRLANWFAKRLSSLPAPGRPHLDVFAVGDDADLPLLRRLTASEGVLEQVRSTEPIDFKLAAFVSKIGRNPLAQLSFTANPPDNFDFVYPLETTVFPGSAAAWVGQYKAPRREAGFSVRALRDGQEISLDAKAALPAENLDHPGLARTWARARVDALLAKIDREGEDRASIDEIIRLSRKYKFVTPYTSFLAAPRALFRPRVIRPGDPVLRVKTDPSIRSVIAFFPFGLIKKLRYLGNEDVWETRFYAPDDMTDGTYSVRLILRDRAGNVYREAKTFVIETRSPLVRVSLPQKRFHRGQTIPLRVNASKLTRTIVARMYGVPPVYLRWNASAKANTGEIAVPAGLPAGEYKLTVTAEDFAHNVGSKEVPVEILP